MLKNTSTKQKQTNEMGSFFLIQPPLKGEFNNLSTIVTKTTHPHLSKKANICACLAKRSV